MPIGFLISSNLFKKFMIVRFIFIFLLNLHVLRASLLIGALFQNDNNSTIESDEEIVFKHAVYISNQYKSSYLNAASNYPTLLHKIIHIPKLEQLKAIKKVCKDINGNMLALIGPQEETTRLYIKSLSEELNLIHFDIEPSLESTYSFNLYPSLDVLCHGFAELVKRFEWKHLAIIYDSKTNLRKVRCLLGGPGQLMPKLDLTLKIANYDYEYRTILRDISKRRIRNIIIDLEPDKTHQLLKMALQLGMINSTYQYIMTTLDIETVNLDDFKYNRANITAFRLVQTDSPFHKAVTFNLTDYYNTNLKDSEKNKFLLKTRNALMFDSIFAFATAIKEAEKYVNMYDSKVSCADDRPLEVGKVLPNYLEKISINGLTGLITFKNKKRSEFSLDVLQLKETGLFKCGAWSTSTGLNFTYYDEVYNEDLTLPRKNAYRVVTLIEEPYVMEEDGKFRGFCIDILDEIANRMNFRYELYRVADNQYGSEDENGSWNGMIRELMEKKADLAISAFTINYKRQQVVDFTKPFISLGISILYKIPTSKKPGLFSFLNPLSLEIWIYTLITYLLVSLIMMVLARFSPYEWRNTHPCNTENDYVENQFTAWNSLWFAVGTLMQQGSDINPKALSTRLVGGVWWFFTLIIISSYTANLAAFLTVEKVDLTITNAEELANQTKTSYGVFKGGSTMNFFKESRIDTYKRMWKVMQNNPDISFVRSNKEGIDRVLNKDYAYLMESPLIDYEIQRNCNLTQIGGLLDSKGYGIATQRGSPYTEDISLKILEMQERGDIQKYYNKWWKGGGICIRDEKKDSKANALNVENVGGIFVVLVGGLLLAVIVSLFEFIYYAKRNSNRIKKPLCSQMFDEFKFAIKCGGSTKKIQLTNTTAIPLQLSESSLVKPIPHPVNYLKSSSTNDLAQINLINNDNNDNNNNNNMQQLQFQQTIKHQQHIKQQPPSSLQQQQQQQQTNKRECKKCQRLRKERMAYNYSPLQAKIVCKHLINTSSMTSLSANANNNNNSNTNNNNNNSGLLLVEKETSLDAQNLSLNRNNTFSHPHLYQQQQHQQIKSNQSNQFQHNTNILGKNKCPNNKRPQNFDAYDNNNNNNKNADYMPMKQLNQRNQQFENSDINPNQIIPISVDRDNFNNNNNNIQFYDNKPDEQQINYERYLSKSNILKSSTKPSNRH